MLVQKFLNLLLRQKHLPVSLRNTARKRLEKYFETSGFRVLRMMPTGNLAPYFSPH
jgi:hypothetical protein